MATLFLMKSRSRPWTDGPWPVRVSAVAVCCFWLSTINKNRIWITALRQLHCSGLMFISNNLLIRIFNWGDVVINSTPIWRLIANICMGFLMIRFRSAESTLKRWRLKNYKCSVNRFILFAISWCLRIRMMVKSGTILKRIRLFLRILSQIFFSAKMVHR